ncbi:MAG: hypothetical protein HY710_12645 [Candidatus Latescibacteria bacterium]|nr:hypothetical protein [Candidatus Latescibacterota bacterium]
MKKRVFRQWMGLAVLLAGVVLGGCKGGNIFGFKSADKKNSGDLIVKGQEQLRDGQFAQAESTFAQAILADPQNSDARFYHAKASLLASGFSIVTLIRDVTNNANKTGASLPLFSPNPTKPRAEDDAEKTRIYQANITIVKDLEPISQGLTHGSFDSSSIGLDLAIANTIRSFLRLRDTNGDEVINSADFFFDINRTTDENFSFDLGGVITSPDQASSFNTLIRDLTQSEGGQRRSLVQQVLDNLRQAGLLTKDSAIDVDELEKAIDDLGNSASKYFINTGQPGNLGIGDNDGDGRVDEEAINGFDDDGDGLVDEDSHFP